MWLRLMVIVLILVLIAGNAGAFEIADDNFNHFTVGFAIGCISTKWIDTQYVVYDKAMSDKVLHERFEIKKVKQKDFWYYAIPAATLVLYATIKEATDTKWDWRDFGYTIAGGIGGVALISW